jgi:hypothetical protein
MPPDLSVAAVIRLILLTFFEDAETALDMTYGSGQFWDDTAPVQVTAHDSLVERSPGGETMDFTALDYDDASFDVPLFDPPHNADAGADSIMGQRFGTVKGQANLDKLIMDGAREAWRVCRLGVIIKVTDQVHGQLFQSEADLISEALAVNGQWMVPYDVVHHVRSYAIVSPDLTEHYSALNNGATYLIFRKGDQRHKSHRRRGA